MTFGIPGRPAPDPGSPLRTAPTAWVSRRALELNLRAVLSSTRDAVVDVRADAWGHGVREVAPIALHAGAGAVLVDEEGAAALRGLVDADRVVADGPGTAPDAVYGLSAGFTPVLRLSGWVLSVKPLSAGEGVSYGFTHRAARDTTVALVSGGYAQGIVRSLGNAASVRVAGERHPIIGRVAMDVCVVDVGAAPVQRGDEVVFFGDPGRDEPPLSEWTAATGMSAAELVTAVGLANVREHRA